MDMPSQCQREVEQLHGFFQHWFRGELPNTDAAFDRFVSVLEPGFHLIGPDGVVHTRGTIVEIVRKAHGTGRFDKIWIEHFGLLHTTGDLALVAYEEWQSRDGRWRGRRSSAVFISESDSPNGVRWLHVHETFLKMTSDNPNA